MTRAQPYGTPTGFHRPSRIAAEVALSAGAAVLLYVFATAGAPRAYAQTARPTAEGRILELVSGPDRDSAGQDEQVSRRNDAAGREANEEVNDSAREVILSFRYARVAADVSALYVGDDVYLPVGELFSLVGIDWHLERATPAVYGFYLDEERTYRLDFDVGKARVGASTHPLDAADFLVLDHDVFVRPKVFDEMFGLRVLVDMKNLTVYLQSSEMLPVEMQHRRARDRPLLNDPYAAIRHAPLTYDRTRKFLGGGAADYNLSIQRLVNDVRAHVQSAVGAEVLGGDLAWQGRAGIADRPYVAHDFVRWRYAMADNALLRQIRIGRLRADGLASRAIHGIHFTNQPARPDRLFSEYVVAGTAEPDWELELYMDDRLVDVTRVPASGTYGFRVPLLYGTSRLHVRAYGLAGEVRELRRQIQIPFTMISPGEVRYNFNLGENQLERGLLGQADVGYGVSKYVTAKVGVEYAEGAVYDRPRAYASLTSRLLRHYLASAELTGEGLHRFSLSGLFPSQANVELRYSRTEPSSRRLIAGDRARTSAAAFVPFHVGRMPVGVRLSALRTTYGSADQYRLRTHLQASIRGLQMHLRAESEMSAGYRSTSLSPSLTYVWMRPPRSLDFLRGMMVSVRGRYLASHRRLAGIEVNAAHSVTRRTRVQLFTRIGMQRRPASIGLRVSTLLPFARTVTDTRVQNTGATVVQSIRGSVAVDGQNGQLLTSDRPAVGRAAAALRLFVDSNANGRLDADEHVIQHDAVRLDRGSALSSGHRFGVTRVSDLLPYEQYTARIEEGAIANPLWVPHQTTFSFIAEPNAIKHMDVPLYAAGVVQGTVVDRSTGKPYRISGMHVRIVNLDDGAERVLRTFSDGSFYEMGFRPGTYEARLDPSQLEAHDLAVESTTRTFAVRTTENGDVVDDIRFIVERRLGRPETPMMAEADRSAARLALMATGDVPLTRPTAVRLPGATGSGVPLPDSAAADATEPLAGAEAAEPPADAGAAAPAAADSILARAPAASTAVAKAPAERSPGICLAGPRKPEPAVSDVGELPHDPFVPGSHLLVAPPVRVVVLYTWLGLAFLLAVGFSLARRAAMHAAKKATKKFG